MPTLVSTHTTSAPGNTGSSDTLAGRCAATAQHGLAKENHEVMRYEEEEEATNHGNGKEDGAAATAAPPTPFLSTGLSEAFKVDVGDFPLLHVLRAIPQRPLLKLLRHLYLSPMGEGYEIKFSGFPDLILWRDSDPAEPATAAATAGGGGPLPASWRLRTSESNQYDNDEGVKDASRFRLMEVKSPSDSLSTKQIAVNDCLKRCGFDVAVVRVVEVEAKRPPAGSVTRSGTAAPAGKAGGNRAPTTSSSPANLKRQQGKTPRRK